MLVVSAKDLEDDVENGQGTSTSTTGSESGAGVASSESAVPPENPTGGSPETPTTEPEKPEEAQQEKVSGGGQGEGEKPTEKKTFSRQERIDHAFAEVKAKSQRKIRDLEAQIKELRTQITKEIPKKETFKSEDEYSDTRAGVVVKKELLGTKERELSLEQESLNAATEQAKFEAHYDTPEKQASFHEAWAIGNRNGVIKSIREDETVGSFLKDSDVSPLLIEHLCRKPDVFQKILNSGSRKQLELFSLEQRLKSFLRSQNLKQSIPSKQALAKPIVPPAADNKPKVPILGSQQKAQNNKVGDADDFEKESDIFDFVRGK